MAQSDDRLNLPMPVWLEELGRNYSKMLAGVEQKANQMLAPGTLVDSEDPVLKAGYCMGQLDCLAEVLDMIEQDSRRTGTVPSVILDRDGRTR